MQVFDLNGDKTISIEEFQAVLALNDQLNGTRLHTDGCRYYIFCIQYLPFVGLPIRLRQLTLIFPVLFISLQSTRFEFLQVNCLSLGISGLCVFLVTT